MFFSLKTESYFSTLSSLNNSKKKLYANVSEMFSIDPKTSIRKYLIFCSFYNFFSANVSDFYTYYFTIKN